MKCRSAVIASLCVLLWYAQAAVPTPVLMAAHPSHRINIQHETRRHHAKHWYWRHGKCDVRWHNRYCAKHWPWDGHGACRWHRFRSYCRAHVRRWAPEKATQAAPQGGYWINAQVTAYCDSGITAADTYTSWGTVAAGPSWPFGVRLFIPGYGYGTVLDRGGDVADGIFDLYMPSCAECFAWGRVNERIEVLN